MTANKVVHSMGRVCYKAAKTITEN